MLLRLAQPPDPCGSQHLWLEHAMHVLGFEPRPLCTMSLCPCHRAAVALGVPVPQGARRSMTGVCAGYL